MQCTPDASTGTVQSQLEQSKTYLTVTSNDVLKVPTGSATRTKPTKLKYNLQKLRKPFTK